MQKKLIYNQIKDISQMIKSAKAVAKSQTEVVAAEEEQEKQDHRRNSSISNFDQSYL